MVFISFEYIAFLALVYILHYVAPKKYRYLVLLGASYYFYGKFGWESIVTLLALTLMTYVGGLVLAKRPRKRYLWASLLAILSMMLVTKYTNFVLSVFGNFEPLSIFAALGISYYTFMAITYCVDVYRGKINPIRNGFYLAFYLSFFPHVLQGPITKARDFIPQMNTFSYNEKTVQHALFQIAWGMIQKAWIADKIGLIVNPYFQNIEAQNGLQLLVAVILYAFQIYTDFAGYSDIAIGTARLFGYRLAPNFDRPYFAKSIAEFWRRWHISLGAWLSEYVYIPLGGNRKGTFRKYLNILIVFLVSGLWHGASLNFVIWGLLHGIYQIIGALTLRFRTAFKARLKLKDAFTVVKIVQVGIVFTLVTFAWIFFRTASVDDALLVIRKIALMEGVESVNFSLKPMLNAIIAIFPSQFEFVHIGMSLTLLGFISILRRRMKWLTFDKKVARPLKYMVAAVMVALVFLALLNGGANAESQFIYFEF